MGTLPQKGRDPKYLRNLRHVRKLNDKRRQKAKQRRRHLQQAAKKKGNPLWSRIQLPVKGHKYTWYRGQIQYFKEVDGKKVTVSKRVHRELILEARKAKKAAKKAAVAKES